MPSAAPPIPAARTAALAAATSWLAAQGRLPLAFMGLGLAWLVAGSALLAANPWILSLPHMTPPVVALVHAWVLGFFVTVACGAVYQLAPVALGTTLASERRGWWHFWLHAAGVPGMVYAFWRWDMALLGHFGTAVALGVVFFADNTWRTVRRSDKRGPVAWSLVLASGWILLTVLAGLTVAANKFWAFIPADPLALLRAHAHLGIIGFFATLLQGAGFQLIPMFTLAEVPDWKPAKAGLVLSQAGLLGLVPSLAVDFRTGTVLSALLVAAGFASSGYGLARTFSTRRKRAVDPGVLALFLGLGGLGGAAVSGLALALAGPRTIPGGLNAVSYGVLALVGGLLPCIAGMMCKVVPFLVWMRAYGPRVGRGPTPAAASLSHAGLEKLGLGLMGASLLPLLVGSGNSSVPALTAGAGLLATGVFFFSANLLRVMSHLWRPAGFAPAPGGRP